MKTRLTDEEVICTWMEPNAPKNGVIPNSERLNKFSPNGWWRYSMLACCWKQAILITCPEIERLGWLWKVEDRLSDGLWHGYCATFAVEFIDQEVAIESAVNHAAQINWDKMHLHATPAQKIAALAAVLRPEVEKAMEVVE